MSKGNLKINIVGYISEHQWGAVIRGGSCPSQVSVQHKAPQLVIRKWKSYKKDSTIAEQDNINQTPCTR